jgi:hypothetical protein
VLFRQIRAERAAERLALISRIELRAARGAAEAEREELNERYLPPGAHQIRYWTFHG